MTDKETKITDLMGDNQEKKFTFDFCFWSFDGFQPNADGYLQPLNSTYMQPGVKSS
jgi:hypothetical protein